jgi:hemolysin activation/secretion protein
MSFHTRWHLLLCASAAALACPVSAQDAFDQAEEMDRAAQTEQRGDYKADTPRIATNETTRIAAADTDEDGLTIGSIIIRGNEALPVSHFVELIEKYTSRPLAQSDLAELADAIARRAREAGYVFATASIPQQSLSLGVLRVELEEGKVDTIRIEGADEPAIQRQLAPLASGKPVTRAELERHILLADDISGVRILDSRFEREGDTGVLIVRARRSHAFAAVELSNDGSEPVGPIRGRVSVGLNGVISSADEVDLSFGTTPLQPGELQFARASYRIVVDASGLELGAHLSYSSTDPGDFLADRDIEGQFWRAGIEASYPLLRSRNASVWVIGEFEVTDLRQDRAGALARRDRVPVVRAGIYSRGRLAGGTYRGRLTLSRGLSILSATRPDDPLASRLDASVNFTSLYAWGAWDRQISGPLSIALGGRAQLATDPVLATEDIGLGGPGFLRGYNFNERAGDQGVMGYGELRYDIRGAGFWLPRAQVYAYADGGVVSNLEDGFGGGSLASAGGGVRLDLTRYLDLGVELAVPLSGPRFDSDSDSPLVNLRVQQSF